MSEPIGVGLSADRAAEELMRLRGRTPQSHAPARLWLAWLEEQAPWWDMLAKRDATLRANAQFVADHVQSKIKELRQRSKLDDPWPGAWKW